MTVVKHVGLATNSMTFGQVLGANNGIGKGFDFLRIALSLSILATHSILVLTGDFGPLLRQPLTFVWESLVPAFFVLSGFLVTGSALRLNLSDFLLNRSFRIVPALAMDILLSALILGPIFTTDSLSSYYTDRKFWTYFRNIVGMIHYELPGVFEQNPFASQVNGSLWTIPFELGCYAIMSVLIVTSLLRRRGATFVLCICLAAMILVMSRSGITMDGVGITNPNVQNILMHFAAPRGVLLYIFFLLGCVLFLYRDHIPFSYLMAILSLIAILVAILFAPDEQLITAPCIAYLTVFVGLCRIPSIPIIRNGDYSYGVYLYSFPIQQALVTAFPGAFNIVSHFLVASCLSLLVAVVSWHWLEKPTLKLRGRLTVKARVSTPPEGKTAA